MEILIYFLAALSLMFSIIGIVNDKYWLLLLCAVLVFPFSYFLSSALNFGAFIFLPLFYFGSAVALYLKNKTVAWFLLMPVFLLALLLLTIVFVFTAGPK